MELDVWNVGKHYSVLRQVQTRQREVDVAANSGYPLKIYMDESGNGNKDLPLIVGAIVTEVDADSIESEIRHLYEELSARRALRGLSTFEEFRKNGFHAKNDPPEISTPFLELIQRAIGFKAYVYFTDRSTFVNLSEAQQIEQLYAILVADLLIRYRSRSEIYCLLEENSELRKLVRTLPDLAARKVVDRLGRSVDLPTLRVSMVKKQEVMSLAVIDYVMMAVSRWVRINYSRDVSDRKYRGFREIAPVLSVLYSAESGLLLNRKVDDAGV